MADDSALPFEGQEVTDLWEERSQIVLAFKHNKDGTDDPSSLHVFSLVYPVVRMSHLVYTFSFDVFKNHTLHLKGSSLKMEDIGEQAKAWTKAKTR